MTGWESLADAFDADRRAATPRATEPVTVSRLDRLVALVTLALFVMMAVRVALAWHAGTFPG